MHNWTRLLTLLKPYSIRNKLQIFREFQGKGRVYCGDALDFLTSMDTDSAGIIFLDPPFNLGKVYAENNSKLDNRPEDEYERWLSAIITESIRVLMPGGALYLYHLPIWAMRLGRSLEKHLMFQHWIAISMKNVFVRGPHLYPAHYALLFFTKGKPAHFRRPKLKPAICRHCDNIVKDYGGYKKIIEQKGINLSDFWDDISPVRHRNKKYRKANELPKTLFDRVIEISGAPNLFYVDPFAGTGSGIIAAVQSGLRFNCCDLIEDNCSIICKRLEDLRPDSTQM